MRAFQLTAPTKTAVNDVDKPEPQGGQVVLKVTGAGVCHSDLHILHATEALFPTPMTFGHEVAGTVDSVAPDVQGWEVGAPVLVYLSYGCGTCRACAAGAENYCEAFPRSTVPGPGLGADGGMAEYISVPARNLVALGDLDPVDAAPLTDAALTPYHAIDLSRERLTPSATVVALGIGGLGHMGLQILRETCGSTIVAVDTDPARLEQAEQLGAHHTLLSDERAADEILKLTGGIGADVVLDFVGVPPTMATAAACIRSHGQVTAVGRGGGEITFAAEAAPIHLPWGATLVKPYGGTRRDLQEVVALAQKGRIDVHVERFGLDDALDVLNKLDAGEIKGRAVLVP